MGFFGRLYYGTPYWAKALAAKLGIDIFDFLGDTTNDDECEGY